MEKNSRFIFDKNINSFSPEGRLYQLEYAIRASDNSGASCVIAKGMETICLVEEKKRNLIDSNLSNDSRSLQLDQFTGCVCSGIPGDLDNGISEIIQEYIDFREKNGHSISIDQLAMSISKKKQILTQQSFTRILGIKTIFFGIDKEIGPLVLKMDASGYFSSHSVCGIGGKECDFTNFLQKSGISRETRYFNYEKTITSTLSLLQQILKNDLKAIDLKITVISIKNKFQILSLNEIDNYLEKLKKINQLTDIKY